MSETVLSFNSSSESQRTQNGKTLILDLDETLACSYQNPELESLQIYTNPSIYRKFHPSGEKQFCYSVIVDVNGEPLKIWGVTRPGLEEFLKFAQEYFENVIIWSAGIGPYVEGICREIFDVNSLNLPRLIWSRKDCSSEPGYFHKPLGDLINKLNGSLIRVDPAKTLIVDDRNYTFLRNPENGVLIPRFAPGKNLDDLTNRSDRSLYQLMDWLKRPEVINSEDFRKLDKTRIFS